MNLFAAIPKPLAPQTESAEVSSSTHQTNPRPKTGKWPVGANGSTIQKSVQRIWITSLHFS